jgi:hypothetical protein
MTSMWDCMSRASPLRLTWGRRSSGPTCTHAARRRHGCGSAGGAASRAQLLPAGPPSAVEVTTQFLCDNPQDSKYSDTRLPRRATASRFEGLFCNCPRRKEEASVSQYRFVIRLRPSLFFVFHT